MDNRPVMSILCNIYSIVIIESRLIFHIMRFISAYIYIYKGECGLFFWVFLARRFWYSLLINFFILVECMSILQQNACVAVCFSSRNSSVRLSCTWIQIDQAVCLSDCLASYVEVWKDTWYIFRNVWRASFLNDSNT